ncbi:MAG: YhjD/YihY/BrkB family envelope integrity protein, partial [Saccharofermentanales bacterium]
LFTNYALVYGGLASIVILMMWMYFISMVLMLGAEINSTIIDFRNREYPFYRRPVVKADTEQNQDEVI